MKISVVTPSFQQGAFIERTLASVAAQEAARFDHFVVDGGSTDNTLEVLRRWGTRVRWISERDRGQTHAVNKGIEATDGEIIGWLNSDDVYYAGALEAVRRRFEADPFLEVVYGQADNLDAHDRVIELYETEPWNPERLRDVCFLCQPAVFFKRSVVARFGPLDEKLQFCMDYEYWLRLAAHGARFAYLERKLAGSRLHRDTKTMSRRVEVHAEINSMLRRSLDKVPDRWLCNYAHHVVGRRISRAERPTRFVTEVCVRSLLASVRWNRSVSPEMWRTVRRWMAGVW